MMTIPVPVDIRRWVERKAKANYSPMSSAIVLALRAAMAAEKREMEVVR